MKQLFLFPDLEWHPMGDMKSIPIKQNIFFEAKPTDAQRRITGDERIAISGIGQLDEGGLYGCINKWSPERFQRWRYCLPGDKPMPEWSR